MTTSKSKRYFFTSLMKSKCQDELELIFGSKKRDEVRRRDAWKRITDELNAQWPEKQQGLKIWRKMWTRLKVEAKARLVDNLPLQQWALDIIDIHNMRSELLGIEEKTNEMVETLPRPVDLVVDIANCTPLQCTVVVQYLKDRQRMTGSIADDEDADGRWQRAVGVLNLLGPMCSASGWYSAIETAKARTSTAIDDDEELTELELQIRTVLHQQTFDGIQSEPAEHHPEESADQLMAEEDCAEEKPIDKRVRPNPISPPQMDVLLYYLELYPFMWSPESCADDIATKTPWLELTGWLNLLGPPKPMVKWQQHLTSAISRVRARVRVPLVTVNDRLLYNLARRTLSPALNVQMKRAPELLQRCGSVTASLGHQLRQLPNAVDDNSSLVYRCWVCPHTKYSSSAALERHLHTTGHFDVERVRAEPPDRDPCDAAQFQCDICKQAFGSKPLLRKHMYVHMRKKSTVVKQEFKCEECDKPFTSTLHCGRHFTAVHMRSAGIADEFAYTTVVNRTMPPDNKVRNTRQFWWQCDQCSETFAKKVEIRRHLTAEHNRADLVSIRDELQRMRRTFGKTTVYRCNFCSFSTVRRAVMHKHFLMLHTSHTPVMCSRCPQTFRTREQLAKHRLAAHGESVVTGDLFVCDMCGATFLLKAALISHIFTTHNRAERPLKCYVPNCPMTYRWPDERRRHYLTVHDKSGKPVPCSFCEKRFWSPHLLNQHMAKKHPSQTFQCDRCIDRPEMEWKMRAEHIRNAHPRDEKYLPKVTKPKRKVKVKGKSKHMTD